MRSWLRPLSIGEMLDRAVTLSVRFFVPLALIWVLYFVPLSVVGYFVNADNAKLFSDMLGQITRGSQDPAVVRQLAAGPHFGTLVGWYFALFFIGYPLANAAILRSTSEAYLESRTPPVDAAYRDGFAQWLPLIGIALIWVALGLVAYIAFLLLVFGFALGITLLIAVAKTFGIIVAVVASLAAVLVIIAGAALTFLSFEVACITQVVEKLGFIRSFTTGLSRVVVRTFRRSLAYGLALFAVYIGFSIVSFAIQAVTLGVFRSPAIGTVLSAVLGIVSGVLGAALTVVYYYDVRIRAEGFDLERAAMIST